jgi:hypothetical protein
MIATMVAANISGETFELQNNLIWVYVAVHLVIVVVKVTMYYLYNRKVDKIDEEPRPYEVVGKETYLELKGKNKNKKGKIDENLYDELTEH